MDPNPNPNPNPSPNPTTDVESLYLLWRLDPDESRRESYRASGLRVLEAIQRHCRVDGGYSGLLRTDRAAEDADPLHSQPDRNEAGSSRRPNVHSNTMESFFLAETLKYLYLLFDDANFANAPAANFVFSTEGHLIPIATAFVIVLTI